MSESRVLLSPPDIGSLEKKLVSDALSSGWAAPAGPDLDAFESEVAGLCGRAHGVGVASGTAGLQLALTALGVKSGDVVICSTMTFVATANAVSYVGAVPVFVIQLVRLETFRFRCLKSPCGGIGLRPKQLGRFYP